MRMNGYMYLINHSVCYETFISTGFYEQWTLSLTNELNGILVVKKNLYAVIVLFIAFKYLHLKHSKRKFLHEFYQSGLHNRKLRVHVAKTRFLCL